MTTRQDLQEGIIQLHHAFANYSMEIYTIEVPFSTFATLQNELGRDLTMIPLVSDQPMRSDEMYYGPLKIRAVPHRERP